MGLTLNEADGWIIGLTILKSILHTYKILIIKAFMITPQEQDTILPSFQGASKVALEANTSELGYWHQEEAIGTLTDVIDKGSL